MMRFESPSEAPFAGHKRRESLTRGNKFGNA